MCLANCEGSHRVCSNNCRSPIDKKKGHQLTADLTTLLLGRSPNEASPTANCLLDWTLVATTNNIHLSALFFGKESIEPHSCFFVTMIAWPTRLMRVHWKVFAGGPKVSFSSCSDGSMKSRAVCSLSDWWSQPWDRGRVEEEEEEVHVQTSHYLPPTLSGTHLNLDTFLLRSAQNYFLQQLTSFCDHVFQFCCLSSFNCMYNWSWSLAEILKRNVPNWNHPWTKNCNFC